MIRPISSKTSLTLFGALAMVAAAQAGPQSLLKLAPMPNTVLPVVAKSMPTFALSSTTSATSKIEVAITLKPQDPTGLQAFADAVSDPKSAMYRHFISPEEVGSRFGASLTDVAAVKDFLTKGGLTITHVGKNNFTIAATGTQAQIESLFATKIGNFQVTDESGSVTYRANITPLNVPATLVNKIQSIDGVETYSRPKPRGTSLTPSMTRNLYGLAPMYAAGWTGSGRTVGISNWDGFKLSNGNLFISNYNLPVPAGGAMSNVSVVTVGTGSQSGPAAGEGDLDFQMVLAVAPLAKIIIYDGTGANLTTVLSTEASANAADVISESYGWNVPAATAAAAHTQHLSMTATGITYMAASGDDGTALAPFDYPDYDPEVLMVGGTIATTDSAGNRTSETSWGNSGGNAGGGGWCTSTAANSSAFNVRPSWQTGNGVPSSSIVNKRLVPDVALHASGANGFNSPFAYFMYYDGSLIQSSGTSASSPTFAAGLATCEQRLFAARNTARLGRIADKIYSQNGRSDVWFDVNSGLSIGNLPSSGGGSLNNTPANPGTGWDFATGWGSINFNNFYSTLIGADQVAINAQGVTTVAGTYVSGSAASLNKVDNNSYNVRSVIAKGLGQVAGFNSLYTIPFTSIASMQVVLAMNGPSGSSAIVTLQNVNTGAYDQISTVGFTGSTQTKTIGLTSSQIASYVRSNGTVSMIIRTTFPARGGLMPSPFVFTCDQASLTAAPLS